MTNQISAQDAITKITGRRPNKNLLPHLEAMYNAARLYQGKRGTDFRLSYADYVGLITPSRLANMQKLLNTGRLWEFMKSNRGYVLTWKGRQERATGVLDTTTACFVNRETSRRNQHFTKGDKHTDASKAAIAAARKGTVHSEETREKMSEAHAGVVCAAATKALISAALTGTTNSDETKARKAAAAAARWARVRAEKQSTQ